MILRKPRRGVLGRARYAVALRRRPVSLAGLLRLWWHDFAIHVLFEGGERCQDCGRSYVRWRSSDALYREVYGSGAGLFCPACFSRRAESKGLSLVWAPFMDLGKP